MKEARSIERLKKTGKSDCDEFKRISTNERISHSSKGDGQSEMNAKAILSSPFNLMTVCQSLQSSGTAMPCHAMHCHLIEIV